MFAAYAYASASAKGRALVDRELYLPKSWTEDSDRCRAARIPEGKSFATKPELARAMVRRALDSVLPIAWVTADAAYGQEWHFRRMLEEAGVGYVLAVPKSQQVKSPAGSWRIDHVLTGAPAEAWERMSCGNGAKGPRVYDWAAAKLPTIEGSDPTHYRWVLARRSLARPEEIAYYLAFAPADVTVSELGPSGRCPVGHRGVLPGSEERVRPGPVRSPPLRRLVPPRHPGHARARLLGGHDSPGPRKGGRRNGSSSLVPLTVAEVRRLLDLAHPREARHRSPARRLYWSRWRRRHQAITRRCHYQRRTRPERVSHEPPPT
ncbi:transposase [Streptomyces bottropensis]|uniref:IS701 family transposase n=1 Tax=Streptomyces bottropensis TaxID=42235 RepID=UPI0036C77697